MKAADFTQNFAGVEWLSAGSTTSSIPSATVSNWLITPPLVFHNGDVVSFQTSALFDQSTPDRLQVRLNVTNTGVNVGTSETSVGDFGKLLLDIDPDYVQAGADSYPVDWTTYQLPVSGLSGDTPGRLAFRYFVEDSGPDGPNGNQVGIDNVTVTPEPSAAMLLLGCSCVVLIRRKRCLRSNSLNV